MAYDARTIANYFIDLSVVDGEPITPMKLQKLIFFAHGWYLALTGKPLIEEPVQAWQYGPVIPEVYKSFKGNDIITSHAERIPELPYGEEHKFVREVLQRVWQLYKPYTAIELSNMTHMPGSPWDKTVEPFKSNGTMPLRLEIPNDLIRNYFVDKTRQS